jgi:hypothetical protein
MHFGLYRSFVMRQLSSFGAQVTDGYEASKQILMSADGGTLVVQAPK